MSERGLASNGRPVVADATTRGERGVEKEAKIERRERRKREKRKRSREGGERVGEREEGGGLAGQPGRQMVAGGRPDCRRSP